MATTLGRLSIHAFVPTLCWYVSCAALPLDVSISLPGECDDRNDVGARRYCIDVAARAEDSKWRVMHRYDDFYVLKGELGQEAKFEDAPFPGKIRMPCVWNVEQCKKDREETRRNGLQTWLQRTIDARAGGLIPDDKDELWKNLLEMFLDPNSKNRENVLDPIRKMSKGLLAEVDNMKKYLTEKVDKVKEIAGTGKSEEITKVETTMDEVTELAEALKDPTPGVDIEEVKEKLEGKMAELAEAETFLDDLYYECGEENSMSCSLEWDNAIRNGNSGIKDFCVRCAAEGGENPLRKRCNICCTKCGGFAYSCGDGTSDTEKCLSEFENAEKRGDFKDICLRCANEGGEDPLRSHCSKCCSKCRTEEGGKTEL